MIKVLLTLILGVFAITSCSGPVGNWSATDAAAAKNISLSPATMATSAYQKPRGYVPNNDNSYLAAMPGGSFAQGATIGVGFSLAKGLYDKAQQEKFEARNYQAIARAKSSTPKSLHSIVSQSLRSKISSSPHISLLKNGQSTLQLEILQHGYAKTKPDPKSDLVSPHIIAKVVLTNNSTSKKLLSRSFSSSGSIQAPLSQFANNHSLAKKAYLSASSNLAQQITAYIAKKSGSNVPKDAAKTPEIRTATAVKKTTTKSSATYKVQQLKNIQIYAVNKNSPYALTQGFNMINRPTTKVQLEGYSFKIAGTSSGKVIMVGTNSIIDTKKFTSKGCPEYLLIKNYLYSKGIRILRQRDIKNITFVDGFFLEMDGDGYSSLRNAQ